MLDELVLNLVEHPLRQNTGFNVIFAPDRNPFRKHHEPASGEP